MTKINIVLADDHVLVRKGIKAMLETDTDIQVIGEANNGTEALEAAKKLRPDILVLDEPTMFLDPPGRRDLIGALQRLSQARIIVTHDVAFARAVGTRAVFFDKGRVIAEGSVDHLVRQFNWNG